MSGHSKWSTIKRQKEANDMARGKVFGKLSRAISIAVKTGGGENPDTNYKLRIAIDAARAANMPKDNIERAITKGGGPENLEEVVYEGYGLGGIAVMVEAATDNRNRTAQEIKNIFERVGGSLAGPGAVSHIFEPKGLLVVDKVSDSEGQLLELIDLGAEDVEETEDGVEVYTNPKSLAQVKAKVEEKGYKITSSGLIQLPKNLQKVGDEAASKTLKFLESLEEHDDVQNVFSNADISEEAAKKAVEE